MQMWLPDQTDHVCKAILAAFPTQFVSRFSCEHVAKDIARISRLPVEIFRAARKHFKPSPVSPALQFSMTDVVKHFSRMMSISADAVADVSELELLSIHFAHQIFCTRSALDCTAMTTIFHQAVTRLRFDAQSVACVDNVGKVYVADCGDADGVMRIQYSKAAELYRTGEERFQWSHRPASKESSAVSEHPQLPKPLSLSNPSTPSSSQARPQRNTPGTSSEQLGDAQRRGSLVTVARKSASGDTVMTPSLYLVRNMLDVYTLLKDGVRNLLLTGDDTSARRSAARVACGVLSFQFKEMSARVKTEDFVDQLKAVVLDTAMRSTPTLLYLDCEFLSTDEFDIAMELAMRQETPERFYSPSDRAQILAFEHQFCSNSAPSQQPSSRSAFRENLKRCVYVALSFGYVCLLVSCSRGCRALLTLLSPGRPRGCSQPSPATRRCTTELASRCSTRSALVRSSSSSAPRCARASRWPWSSLISL